MARFTLPLDRFSDLPREVGFSSLIYWEGGVVQRRSFIIDSMASLPLWSWYIRNQFAAGKPPDVTLIQGSSIGCSRSFIKRLDLSRSIRTVHSYLYSFTPSESFPTFRIFSLVLFEGQIVWLTDLVNDRGSWSPYFAPYSVPREITRTPGSILRRKKKKKTYNKYIPINISTLFQ